VRRNGTHLKGFLQETCVWGAADRVAQSQAGSTVGRIQRRARLCVKGARLKGIKTLAMKIGTEGVEKGNGGEKRGQKENWQLVPKLLNGLVGHTNYGTRGKKEIGTGRSGGKLKWGTKGCQKKKMAAFY